MNKYELWMFFKNLEKEVTERRREIEDELVKGFGVSKDLDGTVNFFDDDYQVKVVGRLSFKVDAESMQELARAQGLENHLDALLRWKPDLNLTEWKRTNQEITSKLQGAITVTPGRPSFTVTKKEEK